MNRPEHDRSKTRDQGMLPQASIPVEWELPQKEWPPVPQVRDVAVCPNKWRLSRGWSSDDLN